MQRIARAYLTDGRINVAIHSTPGRMVSFEGTKADIYHEFDLPAVLAMPEVIVAFDNDQLDWVPKWLRAAGKVEARVQLPAGYELGPGPDYLVTQPKKRKGWKNGEDGPAADTGAGKSAGE